jgi:uncharacterized protein YecE (DUF72 family)
MADLRIGTSSFTATGWQGSFYPKGLRPADYLSYYAQHFDTVEIDSTFYATPNVSVVRSWNAKTPEGFLFAAKVPQEITVTTNSSTVSSPALTIFGLISTASFGLVAFLVWRHNRVERRGPRAENKAVTDATFIRFRCAGKTGKVV